MLLFLHENGKRHDVDKRQGRMHMVLALLCFLLGCFRAYVVDCQWKDAECFIQDKQEISFQGNIRRIEQKTNQKYYFLQNVILQYEDEEITCPSIILSSSSEEYSRNEIIIGKGKVVPFRTARNEGNFDEKKYYESLGVITKVEEKDSGTSVVKESSLWARKLEQLKQQMIRVYDEQLLGEESGILSTIALGEKSLLDEEAKNLFQLAGLAHILAISGVHISIVGMGIYEFFRKKGLSFVTAGIISFMLVWGYSWMSGMSNSTKRAMVMFDLFLLAAILGRAYDMLTALAFVAAILVWEQPRYLINVGVIFSFATVFFIATIGKKVVDNCKSKWQESICFVLAMQLVTIPMVLYYYYEIPTYSFLLNLLLVPLLGVLLGCGLVGGLLGVIGRYGGVFWIGKLLVAVEKVLFLFCHFILYLYEMAADVSLQMKGARVIFGKPSLVRILLYYVLLYIVVYRQELVEFKRKKYQEVTTILLGIGLLLLIFLNQKHQFELDMLDVGQGDGIYLQTDAGARCFFDGGSSSVQEVGKYRILPFLKYKGARNIDYWFVSHTDLDHISGLEEILEEGYVVKHLILPEAMKREDENGVQELCRLAKNNGTDVIFWCAGDYLKEEKVKIGGRSDMDFKATCLYPSMNSTFSGINENCLVVLVETEQAKVLFTGDIGSEQEKEMLAQISDEKRLGKEGIKDVNMLKDVDILKVAHHGSKNSSSSEFLEVVNAKLSLISAGEKNRYGHPSKETLERMKQTETKVYVTKDSGQIQIKENVVTFVK